jgi:tyrosinase
MKVGASTLVLLLACSGIAYGQHVRQSVFTLTPAQITSLRKGISVMQARQPTDPTSWTFQANIHGTTSSATNQEEAQAWNQCQHGSFYFFSWHRMYLYYFERILRAASSDPTLTLPYWNYTDDAHKPDPDRRQLPLPFRQPADPSNPLFVSDRAGPMNDGTGYVPPGDVDTSVAFSYLNFEASPGAGAASFGGGEVSKPVHFQGDFGALELIPHNVIHCDVGGCMCDPLCAAQDPIFFLHHANVDRLWNRWLDKGGGRQDPTSDKVWMSTVFPFYDETGNLVQLTGKDILDTVKQLGYCYDDDPNCSTQCHNVPELYGLPLLLAEQALTAAGFYTGIITRLPPNPPFNPPGTRLSLGEVVAQAPLAGACEPPGTAVGFSLQQHRIIAVH